MRIDRAGWLAVRAGGPGYWGSRPHRDSWRRPIFAHTSPIYVAVGGPWRRWDPEVGDAMLRLIDGALGYITDAKSISEEAIAVYRGVKVLVLNALFRTEHPTHLSIPEAVQVAKEIGAERTYLTHLTHHNFHADLEAELPRGIAPAFDGLTIRID